ncbi:hypothetical protein DSCA_09050 [Desulfosarcina alkanivorans]|uniref:Glycosyltransferase subfamily 4-like N-terminal domain-containing protein n=1 Tax=Desulfosarcina alkanivorans TaxID=571177 RepID=A0A5K7YEV3_9BACT|nr:hypothetical protein [Desulfosarcina alkanivorans]BBO66975.1 hypothetical protein DSCA_09050 [Desulfosarcina alkanivorans]
MKVALVHYHLKTGGVTTVLSSQIAALRNACELIVLTGDRAAAGLPCEVAEIPGLGYDRPGRSQPSPDSVAARMIKVLSEKWPGGCDVLHIHNPTLAKNRSFLQIIKRLQQSGITLFLQIHDFAEDGRPGVYFRDAYPADCHYGVINARDAGILKGAGLKPRGVHLLPNAVAGLTAGMDRSPEPRILYPVRAIRRKNLGEAILLSMFFNGTQRLAVTQPPNSPADAASYRDWVAWVEKNRLHVDFEVGKNTDFGALMNSARSVVTTSITEGFGLTFLEPWTAGKLLWGRRIRGICDDFEARGIRLETLYDRLDVPLAWIDGDAFCRDWHQAVAGAAACYGHRMAADTADAAFARMTRNGRVDFGLLSETFQRQVLGRLIRAPSARDELVDLNPCLACPGEVPHPSAMVEANRRLILAHYGMEQYRRRLLSVYDQVAGHRVEHRIDKAVLRDAFFDLDRFSLLKWGTYVH